MVPLTEVQDSNKRIATELPAGLVAVFAGATSGIGEHTLRAFAQHARSPRVYFVGRSQEAGDRIAGDCGRLNPEGDFTFIKADCSLLREVDSVCRQIKAKERAINILFLTIGSLDFTSATPEGLSLATALAYYARMRFTTNLLPLLTDTTTGTTIPALRRVVTVLNSTYAGPVDTTDIGMAGKKGLSGLPAWQPQVSSMTTLSLEVLAAAHPRVSFVHSFPGLVVTGIGRGFAPTNPRGGRAALVRALEWAFWTVGRLAPIHVPGPESGERHLFLATSDALPARAERGRATTAAAPGAGPAGAGVRFGVMRGSDGEVGSGAYAVDERTRVVSSAVLGVLAKERERGVGEAVWEHTLGVFSQVTGTETMA